MSQPSPVVVNEEEEEKKEEDLDDTLKELPGGICSDGDDTTNTDPRDFFESLTIIESAAITYKMTKIGMQTIVELPVDKLEPNICHRQLLQSDGGITLPEEITLSILGYLKADDQVKSLTAFQQCSKSCYDFAYPFIWEDEHVVSLRGMNIIRETWECSLTGITLSRTPGVVRLWSSLSRVKKMRIVEIGPLHVANAVAGEIPPTPKGAKPPHRFIYSAPYQGLQEVIFTEAAGTQSLKQARLQGPLLPDFSYLDRVHTRDKATTWIELMMRGFYLAFYSFSATRRPISLVTIELPDRESLSDIRSREQILYDNYYGTYHDRTGKSIEAVFFRNVSELTECSQTLRLTNVHGAETRDLNAFPQNWAGGELITTYRPSEPNVAYSQSVENQLRSLVPYIVWWIRAEVKGRRSKTPLPKFVIHVPLSSDTAPNLETLSSMVESGYLTSPAREWTKSRLCAAEMYRKLQYLVASVDHPKLDCGKKSLVFRTCERIHLDLAGLDKEDLDEDTTKQANQQSRSNSQRLRASLKIPRSAARDRWGPMYH